MTLELSRSGFILYVAPYEACVSFYRNVVGLKTLFGTPTLTCFEFGGSYLMVERDEDAGESSEGSSASSICLRMNVPDVKAQADRLEGLGVAVDYQEHAWGTVAKFRDPARNLCAFKDDEKFERQVREGAASQGHDE